MVSVVANLASRVMLCVCTYVHCAQLGVDTACIMMHGDYAILCSNDACTTVANIMYFDT